MHSRCGRLSILALLQPVLIPGGLLQGAPSCWFSSVALEHGAGVREYGEHTSRHHAPLTTLLALEHTIQQRQADLANGQGGLKDSLPASFGSGMDGSSLFAISCIVCG